MYYLDARYYNPEIGRFITEDPDPGDDKDRLTKTPYLYCKNSPIIKKDPSGLYYVPIGSGEKLNYFLDISVTNRRKRSKVKKSLGINESNFYYGKGYGHKYGYSYYRGKPVNSKTYQKYNPKPQHKPIIKRKTIKKTKIKIDPVSSYKETYNNSVTYIDGVGLKIEQRGFCSITTGSGKTTFSSNGFSWGPFTYSNNSGRVSFDVGSVNITGKYSKNGSDLSIKTGDNRYSIGRKGLYTTTLGYDYGKNTKKGNDKIYKGTG